MPKNLQKKNVPAKVNKPKRAQKEEPKPKQTKPKSSGRNFKA